MKFDERLYPFQHKGVSFIDSLRGRAILGDEMGLGKTVQALCWAEQKCSRGRIYICAPANVVYKWKEEIKTWTTRKDPKILIGYATAFPKTDTIISSYNVMTNRYKEIRNWLRESSDPALVIWDEAHYLKGNRKKTKRVAASLRLHSEHALFLTGTPFLNRPIELFNILDMVEPGKWNLGKYGTRYCGGFDYWKGPLKGAENLSELRSKLKSIMIRRLKRDVLKDLPALSRVVLPIDIRTTEYRRALRGINSTTAATKIMDAWHIIGREKAKAAILWVEDFFTQSEDNVKIVIYAHHLDVIQTLVSGLRHHGTVFISGTVSLDKRDIYVRAFQNGTRPRVMVINKAGGEGIDLFGKGKVDSSTILFVERQWTPGLEWQAEGRLDRIGQNSGVIAYYLSAIGTFDVTMAKAITAKEGIIGKVMEVENINLNITKEIISNLL